MAETRKSKEGLDGVPRHPARYHGGLNAKRLDGVDLLRGLAIFLVLMNHVNMRLRIARIPYTEGWPDQLVSSLVWNGQQGVQIFFAVSGFLITSTSLRRWGSLPGLKPLEFYRFRFARIAPLLLALLAVLAALHFAGAKPYVVSERTGGLGAALWAALTFRVNVLEATRGYLPASWDILWSLSVEEVFYLAFPLAAVTLGRSAWAMTALLLSLVALGPWARATSTGVWHEYSYLGSMDAIAMGCLTALILDGRRFSAPRLRQAGLAGLVILAGCLGASRTLASIGLEKSGWSMTLVGLSTCLIMAPAAQLGWRSPAWLAPLKSLGRLSYEVYLTHMFVIFTVFAVFVANGRRLEDVWWFFAASIAGSALLGYVVSRWYSEPMNQRLRDNGRDDSSGSRPRSGRGAAARAS